MSRFLLFFAMMLGAFNGMTQTPTVANLVATGTGIKWYAAPTGGSPLATSTALVNGTTYYASQTVNGVESATRFAVTATLVIQAAPATGTHVPSQTQVVWNWNASSGAIGYKWNTTNNYGGATDMGNVLTRTETSLTCNTAYNRYVWAYNASGCVSVATTLSQTTAACGETPWSGSLSGKGAIGETLDFLVTGTLSGGSIWGCDVYTDDSNLATAAVHDGWVADGVTKHIQVTILAGQASYTSCPQNGITSSSYGSWPRSYQIISSW